MRNTVKMNYKSTKKKANLCLKTSDSRKTLCSSCSNNEVTPTVRFFKLILFHRRLSWSVFFFSEGTNGEGEVSPLLWDDVAFLPEQAQQQVRGVVGPAVDPGVLEPVGDMSL